MGLEGRLLASEVVALRCQTNVDEMLIQQVDQIRRQEVNEVDRVQTLAAESFYFLNDYY